MKTNVTYWKDVRDWLNQRTEEELSSVPLVYGEDGALRIEFLEVTEESWYESAGAGSEVVFTNKGAIDDGEYFDPSNNEIAIPVGSIRAFESGAEECSGPY